MAIRLGDITKGIDMGRGPRGSSETLQWRSGRGGNRETRRVMFLKRRKVVPETK